MSVLIVSDIEDSTPKIGCKNDYYNRHCAKYAENAFGMNSSAKKSDVEALGGAHCFTTPVAARFAERMRN
jgi:hypothetical protein